MIRQILQEYRAAQFSAIVEVHGCCRLEVEAVKTSMYDWESHGIFSTTTPEEANLLIVGGWLNTLLVEKIKEHYARMRAPKYVIALGGCAISGAGYQIRRENNKSSISEIIPVDVFIAGCPPGPKDILEGISELKKKIRPEKKQKEILADAIVGLEIN